MQRTGGPCSVDGGGRWGGGGACGADADSSCAGWWGYAAVVLLVLLHVMLLHVIHAQCCNETTRTPLHQPTKHLAAQYPLTGYYPHCATRFM